MGAAGSATIFIPFATGTNETDINLFVVCLLRQQFGPFVLQARTGLLLPQNDLLRLFQKLNTNQNKGYVFD